MKVILLERIAKLGKLGDLVTVKDGFARNFLLPYKKALRATEENKKHFELQRESFEKKSKDLHTVAEGIARGLKNAVFKVAAPASESGMLYGSVSVKDIAKLVSDKVASLVRPAQVLMPTPIKTVGVHTVSLHLHADVDVQITLSIAPSLEEAENQLKSASKKESAEQTEEPVTTE